MSSEFQNKNIQLKSIENKRAHEKKKNRMKRVFQTKYVNPNKGLLQVSVAVSHTPFITLLI